MAELICLSWSLERKQTTSERYLSIPWLPTALVSRAPNKPTYKPKNVGEKSNQSSPTERVLPNALSFTDRRLSGCPGPCGHEGTDSEIICNKVTEDLLLCFGPEVFQLARAFVCLHPFGAMPTSYLIG